MSYLRNCWYCAGWSSELAEGPLERRLLGQYVVLYRDRAGQPVALNGRCPHRFAPLAQGVVHGDNIACPYHGLQFAPDGRCVINPNGSGAIPADSRVHSFPVKERHGVIWIWMGDPERADIELLPNDSFLADPNYATRTGYLKVNGHYQLPIDNLLDLSHGMFLHAKTLLAPAEESRNLVANIPDQLKHDVKVEGDVVYSIYHFPPGPPTGLRRRLVSHDIVCTLSTMKWYPASNLIFDVKVWPGTEVGRGPAALNLPSAHYIVPETETTAHYFVAISRDVKISDPVEDDHMIAIVLDAFVNEDEPMIRRCQELMGTTDLMALRPMILETDRAAILARRILARLIGSEEKGKDIKLAPDILV